MHKSEPHVRSESLYERARRVIPGGVNSPVRAFRAVGGSPLFITRGSGPYIFDADGNRVNYLEHGFQLAIRPDRFASLLASGIPVRMEIDLPAGQDSLRIGIHDVAARRTGSLEVPVTVSPN